MKDLKYDVLVNKYNHLAKEYRPQDLYIVDDNKNNFHHYKNPELKPALRTDIKIYVEKMLNDAKEAGFNIIVDSGYRSYQYQHTIIADVIKKKGVDAYKVAAIPGASEHQTGLAMDIAYMRDGMYCDDVQENDPEVKWLETNCYKYGFVERYPKNKEEITGYSYEPWHYRFVGLELAKELFTNNLTLEEYHLAKENNNNNQLKR